MLAAAAASAGDEEDLQQLRSLPPELLAQVWALLGVRDRARLMRVCKWLRDFSRTHARVARLTTAVGCTSALDARPGLVELQLRDVTCCTRGLDQVLAPARAYAGALTSLSVERAYSNPHGPSESALAPNLLAHVRRVAVGLEHVSCLTALRALSLQNLHLSEPEADAVAASLPRLASLRLMDLRGAHGRIHQALWQGAGSGALTSLTLRALDADEQPAGPPHDHAALSLAGGCPVAGVTALRSLVALELWARPQERVRLAPLGVLRHLRELRVREGIPALALAAELRALAPLTGLRLLSLEPSDAGLEEDAAAAAGPPLPVAIDVSPASALRQLTHLEVSPRDHLGATRGMFAGLSGVAALPALQHVRLGYRMPPREAAYLAGLSGLRSLDLDNDATAYLRPPAPGPAAAAPGPLQLAQLQHLTMLAMHLLNPTKNLPVPWRQLAELRLCAPELGGRCDLDGLCGMLAECSALRALALHDLAVWRPPLDRRSPNELLPQGCLRRLASFATSLSPQGAPGRELTLAVLARAGGSLEELELDVDLDPPSASAGEVEAWHQRVFSAVGACRWLRRLDLRVFWDAPRFDPASLFDPLQALACLESLTMHAEQAVSRVWAALLEPGGTGGDGQASQARAPGRRTLAQPGGDDGEVIAVTVYP
jgi:hypothetical protein